MIVCVSPSSHHYDESFNTLQYANRAKEIKTKVTRNVVSVDRHVSQYVRVIYELRQELDSRKKGDGDSEKKWREDIRQTQAKTKVEVDDVIAKIRKAYEDAKDKIARIGSLRSEISIFQLATSALSSWKATVFPAQEASNPSYTYTIDNFLSYYGSRLDLLSSEKAQSENAKSMFEALYSSLARKSSNPLGNLATQHPELLKLLKAEIKVIELELALAELQTQETTRGQLPHTLGDLLSTVESCKEKANTDFSITNMDATEQRAALANLLLRMNSATQELIATLLSSSSLLPSSSILLTSQPLGSLAPAQYPVHPKSFPSKKRPAMLRSPLPDSSCGSVHHARPGKIQRSSLAGTAVSGSTSSLRERKSPRRQILHPAIQRPPSAASRPILRPPAHVGRPSNSSSAASAVAAKKESEKKAVVWKDDAGEQLTEEHTKSVIDFTDTSGDLSGSTTTSNSTISSAAVPPPSNPAGRIANGFLSRKINSSGAPSRTLQHAILEEEESSTSVTSSSSEMPAARILADIGNNSVASSSADSSFGSEGTAVASKPIMHARLGLGFKARSSLAPKSIATPRKASGGPMGRRISSVGPIRSAKKNRRSSFLDPIKASNTSASNPSATSPRRAGRATLSFPNKLVPNAEDTAGGRRQSLMMLDRPTTGGLSSRVAAARAKRESLAIVRATQSPALSSGPSGSGRNFELSLDLSNPNGKPPVWK